MKIQKPRKTRKIVLKLQISQSISTQTLPCSSKQVISSYSLLTSVFPEKLLVEIYRNMLQ